MNNIDDLIKSAWQRDYESTGTPHEKEVQELIEIVKDWTPERKHEDISVAIYRLEQDIALRYYRQGMIAGFNAAIGKGGIRA